MLLNKEADRILWTIHNSNW